MPNSFSRAPCGPISMPPPSPPPCVSSASAIAASAQSLRSPSTASKPGWIEWDKAPPCPSERSSDLSAFSKEAAFTSVGQVGNLRPIGNRPVDLHENRHQAASSLPRSEEHTSEL